MSTALLWHLHQPEYRDPTTGVPCMPWTRLHALRGYRDLLVETVESGVPWTLNIVPGLWEQLLYACEGGSDRHLDLTRAPADSVDPDEVARAFPCGNPVMRRHPRYRELEARIAAGVRLGTAELADLQVWSTLAWFGATAVRDWPVLQALRDKGRGFTPADKEDLLTVQSALLAELPGWLHKLAETDGPSLSTTPLHHPILPLLIDLSHAGRSVGSAPTADFRWPSDALAQLVQGKAVMEAHYGRSIHGCWPSEGALSPEVLPLLAEAGFRWVASDEEMLQRSVRTGAGEGAWDLGHGVLGFFRDRAVSDRIGFVYADWEPARSVADFCAHAASTGVKLVALDGENPWESYADAGAAFRKGMIDFLMEQGTTLDAVVEPVGKVEHLHTGSWIGANLEIWAGSEADHDAWDLLAEARRVCDVPAALPHLLAAEGSDWFWWYGPEFDTPFAPVFDASFRAHLQAAYQAAGLSAPAVLSAPVETASTHLEGPKRAIVGGDAGAGWIGAGRWVLPQGAMAVGGGSIVEFGWDGTGALWVRAAMEVQIDGTVWTGPVRLEDAELRVGHHSVRIRRHDWGL